ncbi:MAG TPA: YbhB/YbcL family Raf kinase inhibitor-like protein [Candidatus Tyrphobacter sp.]
MLPHMLAFALLSSDFTPGGRIPQSAAFGRPSCPGGNRSPELHWTAPPPGTQSLALVVFDPDASHGGWYHWLVYDLAPSVRSLAAGAALPLGELGFTSFGKRGYGGPCPPTGPSHHYVFTLYALDARTIADGTLDGRELLARMRGHVLATAQLIGLYGI